MTVFIANFGLGNALWPRCRDSSHIATYCDDDATWPLWLAGDRDAYTAFAIAYKTTVRGIAVTKPVASRWFNLLSIVRESSRDIWIHREKEEIWWTTSVDGPAVTSRVLAPWPDAKTPYVQLVEKATEPWQDISRTGARLLWSSLHPKAKHFLFTEGTLQEPTPDNADYAKALIDGKDLSSWHSQAAWKELAERAGHGAVHTLDSWEKAALRMARTAEDTAKSSVGEPKLQAPKFKRFDFGSVHELAEYIGALLDAQEHACAISGLPLQSDGELDDLELLASLDRIDSDGHYARGNLQIVCRFINRWKSNGDDATFRRLVFLLRSRSSGIG